MARRNIHSHTKKQAQGTQVFDIWRVRMPACPAASFRVLNYPMRLFAPSVAEVRCCEPVGFRQFDLSLRQGCQPRMASGQLSGPQ